MCYYILAVELALPGTQSISFAVANGLIDGAANQVMLYVAGELGPPLARAT